MTLQRFGTESKAHEYIFENRRLIDDRHHCLYRVTNMPFVTYGRNVVNHRYRHGDIWLWRLVLLPERNPVVLGDRVAEAGFVSSRLRRRLPEEQ